MSQPEQIRTYHRTGGASRPGEEGVFDLDRSLDRHLVHSVCPRIAQLRFESSNPSGLGSAFEMGYARANGIPIVFVDEKKTQHTEWLGVHADAVVHTLNEGIDVLRSTIASLARHD